MVSFLPLPGTFFALANRTLSPSLVSTPNTSAYNGRALRLAGFIGSRITATRKLLITRYVVPFPYVAAASTMSFWLPTESPAIWISVYLLVPITFNLFNVRRYGEFEFWLTSVKVVTCVGLFILGVLLPMDASPQQPLLGTSNQNNTYDVVPCSNSTLPCVAQPGFLCMAITSQH